MPRVSVVIPVFNRGKFICATIESVLSQTYRDFEVIAVDDGSQDDSREVLDSFGSSIRCLEHPGRANRGQSASINLGMRNACGELIAILDSDDLWLPHKLAAQVECLESHPEVGLVYGNGWAIDEKDVRKYPIYPAGHREYSDAGRVLLDCYLSLPSNALVRADVYRKVGEFDEKLRASQDHDMVIRIAEVTKLAYIDSHLWCYRRHGGSISANSAELRWRNGFRIVEAAKRRHPYAKGVLRRRRAVLHFRLGQCSFSAGRFLRALVHFAVASILDPGRTISVIVGNERLSSPN